MAGLLLDTHVFLWWRQGGQRLPKEIREAIIDSELVFVSSASAWEIAIKRSLGRLQIPGTVAAGIEDSQFSPLLVSLAHADAVAELREQLAQVAAVGAVAPTVVGEVLWPIGRPQAALQIGEPLRGGVDPKLGGLGA